MTAACIIIKNLPCRVESARHSCRRGTPLVIYNGDSTLRRVVDATPGWRIHPEMPLDTALARCPDAVAIPADSALYAQQWRAAINRLRNVIHAVEDAGLGAAHAQIDTHDDCPYDEPRIVASLMSCVPHDWEPQVGIAADRLAAHCAASIAQPGRALRVPDAPSLRNDFLAPLPVNLLPVDVNVLAGLYDRGIHRLGQLDDLSAAGLETTISELNTPAAMLEPHPEIPAPRDQSRPSCPPLCNPTPHRPVPCAPLPRWV